MVTSARRRRTRPSAATVALVLGLAVLGIAGCSGLAPFGTRGQGPVRTETREIGSFSRIAVSGGISVVVENGGDPKLSVSAQENIVPLIDTQVEGDTLRIGGNGTYTTSETVEVAVSVAALDGIELSGGSRAEIDGVAANTFDVVVSGGAALGAEGSADRLVLNASGGSRADMAALAAGDVALDVSGGSNVTVQASERVSGSASGNARATVLGDAAVDVATSSGGIVDRQ